jgi:hypothetical protein
LGGSVSRVLLPGVEDHFLLEGQGCVISPGLQGESRSLDIHVGDRLDIVRPDGSVFSTFVQGLNFLSGEVRRACNPILLPPAVSKTDVPVGSEVWLVRE